MSGKVSSRARLLSGGRVDLTLCSGDGGAGVLGVDKGVEGDLFGG